MSDHDCAGCWRYNASTDRAVCIVCGAVRAPDFATDGGLPQHLTPTNTIDGGTIYRCTRCGCEGEGVVSHLDGCPAAPADGDERVGDHDIVTDGGVETIDDLTEEMYGELDTVFGRYNDLVRARPDLVVALLINMADGIRSKFNIDVDAKRLADGQYVVYCAGDDTAGFLGFERHDDGRIVTSDMPDGMDGEPLEDDPELVTDGGETACARCGGTGEITKSVAGRSGLIPCPDCDTVPDYALPDEVPDDPVARLEQIDQQLRDLQREKEAWEEARRQVGISQEALREVESHDRVDDSTAERLAFVRTMIDTVLHGVGVGRGIQHEREQLRQEKQELETYLEHVDDEDEIVTDGGRVVSEPEADLDALRQTECVNCGAALDLAATARFARVGEIDSGWLCDECDAALCDLCDGRGWVHFQLAGQFDCPECTGGEDA